MATHHTGGTRTVEQQNTHTWEHRKDFSFLSFVKQIVYKVTFTAYLKLGLFWQDLEAEGILSEKSVHREKHHTCVYLLQKGTPWQVKSKLHQRPARWASELSIGSTRSVGEGLLTGAGMTPECCVTEKPILTRVTIKKAGVLELCAPFTGMSVGPRLPSHSCSVSSSLSSCWPL